MCPDYPPPLPLLLKLQMLENHHSVIFEKCTFFKSQNMKKWKTCFFEISRISRNKWWNWYFWAQNPRFHIAFTFSFAQILIDFDGFFYFSWRGIPMKKRRFWWIFGLFVKGYPYEKTSILMDFSTFREGVPLPVWKKQLRL